MFLHHALPWGRCALSICCGLFALAGLSAHLFASDQPVSRSTSLYQPLALDDVFAPQTPVQFSVPAVSKETTAQENEPEKDPRPAAAMTNKSLPSQGGNVTFLPVRRSTIPPKKPAPSILQQFPAVPPPAASGATPPGLITRQPETLSPNQPASWQPPAVQPPTGQQGSAPPNNLQPPSSVPPNAADQLPDGPLNSQLTAERVQQLQALVDADAELSVEKKAELSQKLKQAVESIKIAETSAATAKQNVEDVKQAPALIDQLKLDLAKPPAEVKVEVDPNATLIQLEQQQASADAALKDLQKSAESTAASNASRTDRKSKLPGTIEKTKQDLNAAKAEQAPSAGTATAGTATATAGTATAGTAMLVSQLEVAARVARLQAQLSMFESDVRRMEARAALHPLNDEMLQRKLASQKKIVTQWKEVVTNFRKAEAERQAREARENVRNAHPNLHVLAERNATLAEERVKLAALIESRATELETVKNDLADVSEDFTNVKGKQKAAGLTTAIGLYLRNERNRLPDQAGLRHAMANVEAEISRVQLATMALRDEQKNIADHNASVKRVMAEVDADASELSEVDVRQMVDEMLTAQRGYVSQLLNDYTTYLDELNDLDFETRQLSAQANAYAAYIDENVLWIRSTSVLSLHDGSLAAQSFREFMAPQRWRELADAVWQAVVHHPFFSSMAVVLCLVIVVFERRIRQKLHTLSSDVSAGNSDIALGFEGSRVGDLLSDESGNEPSVNTDESARFLPTVLGLLLTVASASLWPAMLGVVSWMLVTAPESTPFVHAVATALGTTALAMWTLGVLRQLCRQQGIGETQFEWNADDLKIAHRNLSWLMTFGLPIVFCVVLIDAHGHMAWIDSAGRLLFVAGMCVLSSRFARAIHPERGAVRQALLDHPDGWLNRLRIVWYPLSVGTPLVIAVLAAIGFYYTAQQLTERLITTVWIGVGLILLHALVNRWAKLTERRLRADAVAAAAAAAAQLAAASAGTTVSESAMDASTGAASSLAPVNDPLAAPLEPDSTQNESPAIVTDPENGVPLDPMHAEKQIATHAQQIRKLAAGGLLVAFLVGCWLIWAAVLPALGILDRFELWEQVVNVTEVVDTGDGKTTTQNITKKLPITLNHLMLSVAIVVLTIAGAQNIPGLLEVAIFRRLPLDDGGRHALTTIFRYILTLVGFVFAFRMIGITWASVQWLAAAMTVGLAFGLQEIFANFVSGLILLFERPIRIGDLVTVGATTGNVTNMKIRATTITDFDRRELIVPNKTFITSEFVNWTLSDPVTRIVLPVGVAYGTDTQRVHDILLKVATDHVLVMPDPEPSVLFKTFGDSALNFDLRVFILQRSHYVQVVNEINRRIMKDFAAARIEIAFPQRDIHIRTMRGIEQLMPNRSQSAKAA